MVINIKTYIMIFPMIYTICFRHMRTSLKMSIRNTRLYPYRFIYQNQPPTRERDVKRTKRNIMPCAVKVAMHWHVPNVKTVAVRRSKVMYYGNIYNLGDENENNHKS